MRGLVYGLALGILSSCVSAIAAFLVEGDVARGVLIVISIAIAFAAQAAASYTYSGKESGK